MRSTAPAPIDRIAGEVVKDLTHETNRTQADLAEFLEIGQPALSLRFRRGYSWPLSELVALSHWLGRDVLSAIAKESNRAKQAKS